MKFDVYGRFQLEVVREDGVWAVYRLVPGKRIRNDDFIIPADVEPNDIATYLDDLFHEGAVPGRRVRLLTGATDSPAYDPFVRGRFPVGVRTVHGLDPARNRRFRQMVILRRADHMHFMDDVEQMHEAVRKMPFPAGSSWVQQEMRPAAELCSGAEAHLFVRGLTQCHLDAVLRGQEEARRLLAGDIKTELAERGVDVIAHARH